MKKIFLTIALLIGNFVTYAQIGSQQIIEYTPGTSLISSNDIDGDGDLDVFGTYGHDVTWYKNINGQGSFVTQQTIVGGLWGNSIVASADLNGDTYIDMITTLDDSNGITWYKNMGGQGDNFIKQQTIYQSSNDTQEHPQQAYPVDIDNDGDLDIVIRGRRFSSGVYWIIWFENLDGQGNFGGMNIISANFFGLFDIHLADIDGDGDLDISAASLDPKIVWFENLDGQGSFGSEQIISTEMYQAYTVFASDINNDYNMDIIASINTEAPYYEKRIVWYENLGDEIFAEAEIISQENLAIYDLIAVDINNDENVDLYSFNYNGVEHEIVWYENLDGQGSFEKHLITGESSMNTYGGRQALDINDIDGDGIIDLLVAPTLSDGSGKVVWYKNHFPILSVNENIELDFSVYPNPATSIININSKSTILKTEIYNVLGQLVLSNSNENRIDISSLSKGIYYIKIQDENENFGLEKIINK